MADNHEHHDHDHGHTTAPLPSIDAYLSDLANRLAAVEQRLDTCTACTGSGPTTPDPEPEPSGHRPARFTPGPIETAWPDPANETHTNYRTPAEHRPNLLIRTGLYPHRERNAALTTSNNAAGEAHTDPLVRPGTPQPADHAHTFLGNRLTQNADLEHLGSEPTDWEPGSNADRTGIGFPGLINTPTGPFGYSPGIWWPTIHFDGQPVDLKAGIATYYVRRPGVHDGHRVFMLPNGVGYVTMNQAALQDNPGKDWRIRVFGPSWFHEEIHVGPFPEVDMHYNDPWLSYDSVKPDGPGWHACAQFQIYIKFAVPASAPSFNDILRDGGQRSPRFTYGAPDNHHLPFHLDYVSGWTDYDFGQYLIDRTINRDINDPGGNVKFEGWRAVWR